MQPFESKADAYYFLSATGGMSYQISDHLVADFGVSWEHLLNPLEVDLTSTVDFGGGAGHHDPRSSGDDPQGGGRLCKHDVVPLSSAEGDHRRESAL